MKKAEELLNIKYTNFNYSIYDMYNDLVNKICKYFYLDKEIISADKYNKFNKLCSGYFILFITPKIGQKYKKDCYNNLSRYNYSYIKNSKKFWQETMRLNPSRKVEDLINRNKKSSAIENNRLNRTNTNENGFNIKSNCCTQCVLPFMHYKI